MLPKVIAVEGAVELDPDTEKLIFAEVLAPEVFQALTVTACEPDPMLRVVSSLELFTVYLSDPLS